VVDSLSLRVAAKGKGNRRWHYDDIGAPVRRFLKKASLFFFFLFISKVKQEPLHFVFHLLVIIRLLKHTGTHTHTHKHN
jgi:hypothetical protein